RGTRKGDEAIQAGRFDKLKPFDEFRPWAEAERVPSQSRKDRHGQLNWPRSHRTADLLGGRVGKRRTAGAFVQPGPDGGGEVREVEWLGQLIASFHQGKIFSR